MYNAQSTPYPDESDLLAFEVFVGLADRPSRYLSDDLKDQLAGAARYCSGEMPGPELLQLFSLLGVHLCEQATSVADADGELTSCLCWFAIRRDAEAPKAQARWFDGRQLAAIYLVGVPWIPQGQPGYLGRLERNFRTAIHGSQEFAAYRVARQRLADRIAARWADHRPIAEQLRDFEARLISALVRRSAGEEKQPEEGALEADSGATSAASLVTSPAATAAPEPPVDTEPMAPDISPSAPTVPAAKKDKLPPKQLFPKRAAWLRKHLDD